MVHTDSEDLYEAMGVQEGVIHGGGYNLIFYLRLECCLVHADSEDLYEAIDVQEGVIHGGGSEAQHVGLSVVQLKGQMSID